MAKDGTGHPASAGEGRTVRELSWPVGAVAERLGIAASTLRSWDRRHGIGPTHRTVGNHRRYMESDIRRVLLMSRLTLEGIPAQSAADVLHRMDDDVIERHLSTSPGDDLAVRSAPAAAPPSVTAGGRPDRRGPRSASSTHPAGTRLADATMVDAIVTAASRLDRRALAGLYQQALRQREVGTVWTAVLAPALRRIGELWGEGRLGVESEHFASELMQSELRNVVRAHRLRVAGPPVMLASAGDEHHHLPLLALEAELARLAVPSIFLGPRVPCDAILAAVLHSRPRALFLWASLAHPDLEPLWKGLAAARRPLVVVVGGPGWANPISVDSVDSDDVEVAHATDLQSAVQALLRANR